MSVQVAHDLTLETIDCCNCGIVFAMPSSLKAQFRQYGGTFFCPNGHSQHFTKTEVQRLREALDEQVREATRQSERAMLAEKRSAEAHTRLSNLKKRIKAGACPCCKRSFQNLKRHIATKHPEYSV